MEGGGLFGDYSIEYIISKILLI